VPFQIELENRMLAIVQKCVGCGAPAPDKKEGEAFVSSTSDWRLTRRKSPEGVDVLDWRCPECWRRFKGQLGGSMLPQRQGGKRQ
jgi:hypothetical protein